MNERSKFGQNSRCLHIFKAETIAKLLHFPFDLKVKYPSLNFLKKFHSVTPIFFWYQPVKHGIL